MEENVLFTVTMLPARYGDSLWICYGNLADRHNILIDGGTRGTATSIRSLLNTLPRTQRFIELLVVTHLDRDHIEGILALLKDEELNFRIGEIWFNGWPQLSDQTRDEAFGARQAEELSARILAHDLAWNKSFAGKAIVVPEKGNLPVITLPGLMQLTLLSPLRSDLDKLVPAWENELRLLNLRPGYGMLKQTGKKNIEAFGGSINIDELNETKFHEDDSAGNGSSIAFLAEYAGKKCLFAGDALPSNILASISRLEKNEFWVDLFKLSHHASAHNTSPELLDKLNCARYAISTNGSIYYHPSKETIARVIKRIKPGQEIFFNYRNNFTKIWEDEGLTKRFKYRTRYPKNGQLTIDLMKELEPWEDTQWGETE